MSAIEELEVAFLRGPSFKQESTIPFGGPYDWHDLDGTLTLVRRPLAPEETT